ncbi:PAS domain-containing protein [Fodinicurvata halophila]|uniref:PAS domain-containing protein n=2 Tax=Fodinicurvata halophila TaxID=1419723 RepID=A0ABV8UH21_9PROT
MWPFRNLHWNSGRNPAVFYSDSMPEESNSFFRQSLPHARFIRLLDYWCSKRGSGVPRKTDIDPVEIPALLPFIQIHARQENGRYLCRLSGTAMVEALDMETTGRCLDEFLPERHLKSRTKILDRSLHSGMPIFYTGRLALPGREFLPFRRLILPLSTSGIEADCALTLATVETVGSQAMEKAPPAGISFQVEARPSDLTLPGMTPALS